MNSRTSLSVRLIARSYVPDVTYRVVASPKEFTKVRAGLCPADLAAALLYRPLRILSVTPFSYSTTSHPPKSNPTSPP